MLFLNARLVSFTSLDPHGYSDMIANCKLNGGGKVCEAFFYRWQLGTTLVLPVPSSRGENRNWFFHRFFCKILSSKHPHLSEEVAAGCAGGWWHKNTPQLLVCATIPPFSPSYKHLTTAPAFPWLHTQADVNRWRGWAWIIWIRVGSTRKGWKLRV